MDSETNSALLEIRAESMCTTCPVQTSRRSGLLGWSCMLTGHPRSGDRIPNSCWVRRSTLHPRLVSPGSALHVKPSRLQFSQRGGSQSQNIEQPRGRKGIQLTTPCISTFPYGGTQEQRLPMVHTSLTRYLLSSSSCANRSSRWSEDWSPGQEVSTRNETSWKPTSMPTSNLWSWLEGSGAMCHT